MIKISNELALKELIRSRDEKRILTGTISGIEDEYYKVRNENIACAIVWYESIKILIPVTHLGVKKLNKSMIRGMLRAEIDFIIIELDNVVNITIADRIDAMQLRAKIELPKLKKNDSVKVRILAVGENHILVELYGKEVSIKAEYLQHTYIYNCKKIYTPGEKLKVRITNINIEKDIYELDSKCFLENPFKNICRFITENGEYTARFNHYPHLLDKVLIKVTEIKENNKQIYGYLVRII